MYPANGDGAVPCFVALSKDKKPYIPGRFLGCVKGTFDGMYEICKGGPVITCGYDALVLLLEFDMGRVVQVPLAQVKIEVKK